MKRIALHKRLLSLVLAVVILSGMVFSVRAEKEVVHLTVDCEDESYTLDVLNESDTWYVEVNGLADLAGCKASANQENKKVSLYKDDPIVILYSIDLDESVSKYGKHYVPLQAASVAAGIDFYGFDPLRANVYRTPKEMLKDFDEVFYDQRYQINQILLADGYALGASAAKVYAVLPFVGSGSLLGAISGSDKEERYRTAMASILTTDGSLGSLLGDMSDVTGQIHSNAKLLKAVAELTEKGGVLYEKLLKKGVPVELLDAMAYEKDPYDHLDGFFEDWSKVLSAVNFDYFLDLCAFYATATDTEESIVLAMKRVFENSENEDSKEAVKKLMDARYGDGSIGIPDIYGGMIWDITKEYINNHAEEFLYGGYGAGASIIARGYDRILQASDKTEAYLYFPIYASIQQDLYEYYRDHRDDTQQHAAYDMRAVTIMYLKAAIAAYQYASFDKSLEATLSYATETLSNELANVLSYCEEEIEPSYTNDDLIDWMNHNFGEIANEVVSPETEPTQTTPVETEPQKNWPTQKELFDETYWSMAFGETVGTHYYARFSADGAFVAYCMGSGEYKNGTYTYKNGTLEISMDLGYSGCLSTIQYCWDEKEFISVEKFPMQVGEDFYRIVHAEPEFVAGFFDEYQQTTEQPKTTKDKLYIGTWLFEYTLPLGEKGGRVIITDDSITIKYPEGESAGPYSYTVVHDGQYTNLTFVTDWDEHGVAVCINQDMMGLYFEEYAYGDVCGTPSFGDTGSGRMMFRSGAETTDIELPDSYYQWFYDVEYEYMYYPDANVLYVWNVGDGYYPMYIYEDGTLEYMEAIALLNSDDLPSDAIYTNSNFVITDNK